MPRSADAALLFLRLALGASMIALHGWEKLALYNITAAIFPDPLGLGKEVSLVLTLFAEVLCSALLMVGAFTRFAAAVLAINMSVALCLVHHGDLSPAGDGEPAALYLGGYAVILLAGSGRFSADRAEGPWAVAAFGAIAGLVVGYPWSYHFQAEGHPLTASYNEYIMNIRYVLRDDALQPAAITVWAGSVLFLAAAGALLGLLLYWSRRPAKLS